MEATVGCWLLASRARQVALRTLIEGDGRSTMEELSHVIASHNKPIVDSMEEAQVELFHRHLPMLAEHGVIEYDDRIGDIELTDTGENLEPLLTAVRKFDRMKQETTSRNDV